MCLVGLAWKSHPRWRLLMAGNRDEFHARPTAALQAWGESGGKVLNFYDWMSGVLGAERDRVQFLFGLLPAIFTDILAPLGIAVALFLNKKEPRHG